MTSPAGSDTAREPAAVEITLLDGNALRGTVNNFNPQQPSFFLHTPQGAQRVEFVGVRRVAFLRGAGARTNPTFPASAQLVTVRFNDGSTVEGIAESGGTASRGIYLVPTGDPDAERLYLPLHAVREMVSVQRLGEILVDQRMATRAMVEEALERQRAIQAEPLGEILLRQQRIDAEQLRQSLEMQRHRRQSLIGEILIEQGFATRAEVDEALEQQRAQRNRRLGDILVELGYASTKAIGIALALQHNLAFVSLAGSEPDMALRALVPADFVERWGVVPHALQNDVLVVAVTDPSDLDFKPELQQTTGLPVTEVVVTPQDLARARAAFLGGERASAGPV